MVTETTPTPYLCATHHGGNVALHFPGEPGYREHWRFRVSSLIGKANTAIIASDARRAARAALRKAEGQE